MGEKGDQKHPFFFLYNLEDEHLAVCNLALKLLLEHLFYNGYSSKIQLILC